jgi:hypothetical protein
MGWWVSFDGQSQTHWGGADGQSGYCACGLDGTCQDSSKQCNCDAGQATWLEDSGYLVDFADQFLPVVQLRFGDTAGGAGSEEGYFTLGKLECYITDREYASDVWSRRSKHLTECPRRRACASAE